MNRGLVHGRQSTVHRIRDATQKERIREARLIENGELIDCGLKSQIPNLKSQIRHHSLIISATLS